MLTIALGALLLVWSVVGSVRRSLGDDPRYARLVHHFPRYDPRAFPMYERTLVGSGSGAQKVVVYTPAPGGIAPTGIMSNGVSDAGKSRLVARDAAPAPMAASAQQVDAAQHTPASSEMPSHSTPSHATLSRQEVPQQNYRIAQLTTEPETVLLLTPLKNARKHLPAYFDMIQRFTYPKSRISLGFLVSDSDDGTFDWLQSFVEHQLAAGYRRITLISRDYNYHLTRDERHDYAYQPARRSIMARGRNYLVNRALVDEQWVMWIDSDLTSIPATIIQDLVAHQRPIIVPNCMIKDENSGQLSIYDRNSWQDTEDSRRILRSLDDDETMFEGYEVNTHRRALGDFPRSGKDGSAAWNATVELDGVGGTVLLVRADLHRDGLQFPVVPYRHTIETEGLAQMALDMGVKVYGLPSYVILH